MAKIDYNTEKVVCEQEHYGLITIDNTEEDIVLIYMYEAEECQIIMIERANIDKLIEALNNSRECSQ